jgi:hypothetical protein
MKMLSIKNFTRFQHYSRRLPPWVKLHASVLDDYAFGCLQDASKAHLMLLWVLASRCNNKIPYDVAWLTKRLGAHSPVDVEELVLHGFIEVTDDASAMLASRKQNGGTETETETETEQQRKPKQKQHPRAKKLRGGITANSFALAPYLDAHRELFPDSDPPAARYGKVFKRLERKHGAEATLHRWRNCLAKKATFATPEELSTHWPEYAEKGGAADSLEARVSAAQRDDLTREADDDAWIQGRLAGGA